MFLIRYEMEYFLLRSSCSISHNDNKNLTFRRRPEGLLESKGLKVLNYIRLQRKRLSSLLAREPSRRGARPGTRRGWRWPRARRWTSSVWSTTRPRASGSSGLTTPRKVHTHIKINTTTSSR